MSGFEEFRNKVNNRGGILKIIREQLDNITINSDMKLRYGGPVYDDNEDENEDLENNNGDGLYSKDNTNSTVDNSKPLKTVKNYGEKELLNKKQEVKTNYDGMNTDNLLQLDFTSENVLQGIVYSEILGRPKSKRRRRW